MSGLTHVGAWTSPIVNTTVTVLSDRKVFRVSRNAKATRVTSELLPGKEVAMWTFQRLSPHLRGTAGSSVASAECVTRRECWMPMTTATRPGASWFAPSKALVLSLAPPG